MKTDGTGPPPTVASLSANKTSFIRKYLPDEKLILALVIFVIICAGAILALSYQPKPKTKAKSFQLAGVSIVNQDKTAASKMFAQAAAAQKINIVIKDKTYSYSDKDLGVKRDASSLLDSAYNPPGSIIDNRLVASNEAGTLNTYVQKKKLLAAIDSNIANYKTTQDASVTINGGSLVVNPGRAGISIDFDQLIKQLEQSDLKSSVTITASFTEQQPQILTPAAESAKSAAEALIDPAYGVSANGGAPRFASAAQKASWLVFTPNEAGHTIDVSINSKAAQSTLTKLSQGFAQPAKDKITLTATDGSVSVIDGGQQGMSVDQISLNNGLSQLPSAINNRQAYTMPITVSVQEPGERDLGTSTGGKFVLVDVADYRAYAVDNTTVDRTMVVSTGRPGMETPKGHFTIMRKTKLVTMSGCNVKVGCWVVPNVPNAEFFTKDGDALHGTYWYVNWGHQNLSHGCVNLQLADAAWLYDWTQVGTDVIVA